MFSTTKDFLVRELGTYLTAKRILKDEEFLAGERVAVAAVKLLCILEHGGFIHVRKKKFKNFFSRQPIWCQYENSYVDEAEQSREALLKEINRRRAERLAKAKRQRELLEEIETWED